MMHRIMFPLVAIMLLVNVSQASTKAPDVGVETEEVLNLLLAASTMTIPSQSSCQGDYRQQGKPKVKDVLAMELAYLNRGKNTIAGKCKGEPKSCILRIRHAYGEDVYSADIRFSVHEGALDISTLSCIMTP
jgi:hypothetical protein